MCKVSERMAVVLSITTGCGACLQRMGWPYSRPPRGLASAQHPCYLAMVAQ